MQSTATASSSHQPFFTDDVPAVFDAVAASRLLPQLVDLARLASGGGGGEDSETAARTAKLEIGKQATLVRSTLARLKSQADALPAGDMSLEDQHWLVEQLEAELDRSRQELKELVNVMPKTVTDETTVEASSSSNTATARVDDMQTD